LTPAQKPRGFARRIRMPVAWFRSRCVKSRRPILGATATKVDSAHHRLLTTKRRTTEYTEEAEKARKRGPLMNANTR
jgi:hypothetical protein